MEMKIKFMKQKDRPACARRAGKPLPVRWTQTGEGLSLWLHKAKINRTVPFIHLFKPDPNTLICRLPKISAVIYDAIAVAAEKNTLEKLINFIQLEDLSKPRSEIEGILIFSDPYEVHRQ